MAPGVRGGHPEPYTVPALGKSGKCKEGEQFGRIARRCSIETRGKRGHQSLLIER